MFVQELIITMVVVAVMAIDPITLIAYAVAGYFSPNWQIAALMGTAAGIGVVVLTIILDRASPYQPTSGFNLFLRVVACVLGALAVRGLVHLYRSRKQAEPPANN